MFRRNDKSILHLLANSFAVLFVLVGICGFAHAQSQDPANPTPITSNTVSGQAGPSGATYYYRFQAQKGSTTVTLTGQTNNYSAQFEADLLNMNGDDLGDIYVSAGDQAKSASKPLPLDSAQPITIVVKLTKDSTLKWQKYTINISGTSGSENTGTPGKNYPRKRDNSGDGKRDNMAASLPDLRVTDVQVDGTGHKATVTIANVCNGDVPSDSKLKVQMIIYKGAAQASGADYYVLSGILAPLAAHTTAKVDIALLPTYRVNSFKGRYLRAEVDPFNTIKESVETNNWWETSELPFPDPVDSCDPHAQ